ncbi:MAG: TonB-dependent receptor [Lentimicrobiaceae bacterium]|nr:TonB-dependent receptor [Lentimicrobiaceae bacterium]
MKRIKSFIILSLLLGYLAPCYPQQDCGEATLTEARKRYESGDFNLVISMLTDCADRMSDDQQQVEAYRLLTLSYLAMDSISTATSCATQLLKVNPNFEPDLFDLPRFIQLIRRLNESTRVQLVTSVSKRAENIYEAPANILVVTREEIEQRGYMDLVEMLRDVPGFDLTLFYGSQYANIYQRGFRQNNTEKTLMLIDGIEDNDLWTNWADISRQYPLSNIDRVEIIYGPASTMYGPNAFAGVINIITLDASSYLKEGHKAGIRVNAGYGTYQTAYLDFSLSARKKSFSCSFTGRVYRSDEMDLSSQPYFDYDPAVYDTVNYVPLLSITDRAKEYLIENELPAIHPYYLVSPDSSSITLTPSGDQEARVLDKSGYDQIVNGHPIGFTNKTLCGFLNGKLQFGNFTLGFQSWEKSEGSTTQYTDLLVPGSDNGFQWVPQLSFIYTKYEEQVSNRLYIYSLTNFRIHSLSEDSKFVSVSNYSLGNYDLADLVRETSPKWSTLYAYESSKQLRTEFKVIYEPFQKFNVVSGIEVRNSSLQGSYLYSYYPHPQDSAILVPQPKGGNTYNTWDVGIYAQGTYSLIEQLKITVGARYDYNKIRSNGGFGSEVSPRFAIVYTPGPFVFKAIYSRGIMNVSNWTKYSTAGNRIPNPTLGTESIRNYELTGTWMIRKDLIFDVAFFHSLIDDVVGTVSVPDQPGNNQNANIGIFKINGIQSTLSYKARVWSAYANYTYTDPRQTYSETGKVDNLIGDISRHKFNTGVNKIFFKKLDVNLRLNYTSERETGEGTTVPLNWDTFPGVVLLNGAISYRDLLQGLKLQVVCNNLLDKTCYHPGTKAADGLLSPTSILQRGRHFMISVFYEW